MIPGKTPQITREELAALLLKQYPTLTLDKFAVIGLRGYYKNSMGDVGENDRAIYDDAIILLSENELHTFNGNCDPSKYQKGIAKLKAGVWPVYKFDLHSGKYLALCQRAGNVTVIRDADNLEDTTTGDKEGTGMFGINIHKGGYNTTSSLGCQTIYPTQWARFIATAQRLCENSYGKDYKKQIYAYVLIDM